MSVYFSEKIKQLRKDKDLTQEQVADIFHVSPQSVSRWENGANYPDVELLPHLAVFFNVTLDELLGTDAIKSEEKVKEYRKDICNLLNSGKVDDAIETARKAVKEYPVNYELQNYLIQALCTACSKENPDKFKDEIISIGENIIKYCTDFQNVSWGKFQLIIQYAKWDMKDEAKKIVHTMPSGAYDTQDLTMKYVLDGEELVNDLKHRIVRFAIMLSDFVGLYATKANLNILEKIECYKAVMDIESLPSRVAGSDWVDTVARTFQSIGIAGLYCDAKDSENAVIYVEKATQDAMCHIEQMHETNSSGGNYMAWSTPRNLPWMLWEDNLAKPQFDIIRDDERFIKCFDLLKANSKELK